MADSAPSSSDLWHQEQYARSQDIIKIYNPMGVDFVVSWDKTRNGPDWVFPNKNKVQDDRYGAGYRTVPRYIAWQFMNKFGHAIVMQYVEDRVNEENARRVAIPGGQPMSIEGEGSESDRFRRRVQREFDKYLKADADGHIGVNDDLKALVRWEEVSFFGDTDHPDTSATSGVDIGFLKPSQSPVEAEKAPEKKESKVPMIEHDTKENTKDKALEDLAE